MDRIKSIFFYNIISSKELVYIFRSLALILLFIAGYGFYISFNGFRPVWIDAISAMGIMSSALLVAFTSLHHIRISSDAKRADEIKNYKIKRTDEIKNDIDLIDHVLLMLFRLNDRLNLNTSCLQSGNLNNRVMYVENISTVLRILESFYSHKLISVFRNKHEFLTNIDTMVSALPEYRDFVAKADPEVDLSTLEPVDTSSFEKVLKLVNNLASSISNDRKALENECLSLSLTSD